MITTEVYIKTAKYEILDSVECGKMSVNTARLLNILLDERLSMPFVRGDS